MFFLTTSQQASNYEDLEYQFCVHDPDSLNSISEIIIKWIVTNHHFRVSAAHGKLQVPLKIELRRVPNTRGTESRIHALRTLNIEFSMSSRLSLC